MMVYTVQSPCVSLTSPVHTPHERKKKYYVRLCAVDSAHRIVYCVAKWNIKDETYVVRCMYL